MVKSMTKKPRSRVAFSLISDAIWPRKAGRAAIRSCRLPPIDVLRDSLEESYRSIVPKKRRAQLR